ncbi:MAG: hypothetical protein KAT23_00420 [Anaerolineales bacterium]|nr:hypothetical protein [Anaerolineales bacterium]
MLKITELYSVPLDSGQASLDIPLSGNLDVEDNALTVIAGERFEVVCLAGLWLVMRSVVHEIS